jgi:hypothetical protein
MCTLEYSVADELEDPGQNVNRNHPDEELVLRHSREGEMPACCHEEDHHEHSQLNEGLSTAKMMFMEM